MKNFIKVKNIIITALFLMAAISITCYSQYTKAESEATCYIFSPTENYFYLDMKEPKSFALCNKYYAVAESEVIHIINRENGNYTKITSQTDISKIGFSGERLFVLCDLTLKYTDNFVEFETSGISCNNFIVSETQIVVATTSKITVYVYSTSGFNESSSRGLDGITNGVVPSISFTNDGYSYMDNTFDYKNVIDFKDINGIKYFIGSDGFYKIENSTAIKIDNNKSYIAIANNENKLYLTVKENGYPKIISFDVTTNNFDKFEISGASDSDGRLSNAKDITVINGKVYVADYGNTRIAVFNKNKTFDYNIKLSEKPKFLEGFGNTLLIVCENKMVYLKSITGEKIIDLNFTSYTDIIATAAFDDGFYILTENDRTNSAKVIKIDCDGSKTEIQITNSLTPVKIACDINKNIYIMYNDGKIGKYNHDIFENSQNIDSVTPIATTNVDVKDFAVDVAQNIYILEDNRIIDLLNSKQSVLKGDIGNDDFIAFFIQYFDENIYLLKNNLLMSTNEVAISTLDNIVYDNSLELTSSSYKDQVSGITVDAGNYLFLFNLTDLTEDSNFFPVNDYYKLTQSETLIKIGETADHYIFSGKYTGLVLKTAVSSSIIIDEEDLSETKFLVSNSSVYSYPVIENAFRLFDIDKYSTVTIKAVISGNGIKNTFYKIQYSDGDNILNGYIPSALLCESLSPCPTENSYTLATVNEKNGLKVYSDENLSQGCLVLAFSTPIRIYNDNNGVSYISYFDGEDECFVYASSDKIIYKGKDAVKNTLIILLVLSSVLITVLYFLCRKRKPEDN